MSECTLWLTADGQIERDLVQFLESRGLSLRVQFVPLTGIQQQDIPTLFTRLGTFEGEQSIRRAVSMLMEE